MAARSAWRALAVVGIGAAAVACGLSIVGSGPGDAGSDDDASTGIDPREAAAADTAVEGGEPRPTEDAGCVPVIYDDALTTLDELRWIREGTQADYPAAKDSGRGKTMFAINASMQASQRSRRCSCTQWMPGPPDETPSKALRHDTLVGVLRSVKLRLRKGQLTASTATAADAGDAVSIVGATRSGFVGYFGFTASTGSHYDAAYVGSFHGDSTAGNQP